MADIVIAQDDFEKILERFVRAERILIDLANDMLRMLTLKKEIDPKALSQEGLICIESLKRYKHVMTVVFEKGLTVDDIIKGIIERKELIEDILNSETSAVIGGCEDREDPASEG
ncbi:MAG: hypothetical protein LBU13_10630 [Synergistaceae bacterium]|jgi:hypothetical protein|nr:hypothetical protein [Synergistaceae bacterium]